MDAAPLAAGSVDYARERETTGAWGEQGLLGGRWPSLGNFGNVESQIFYTSKDIISMVGWKLPVGSLNKGFSPRAIIDKI